MVCNPVSWSGAQQQIFQVLQKAGITGLTFNPHSNNITNLLSVIEQEKLNLLNSLSEELNPTIPPLPPPPFLSEILGDKLDEFATQVQDFEEMTNRQSIVNTTQDALPVTQTYLGISSAIQSLELNLGSTEEDALQRGLDLFGNFYNITDTHFAGFTSFVQTITTRFESDEVDIDQAFVENAIDGFIGQLATQMALDDVNYNSALADLVNAGTGYSLTSDPCTAAGTVIQERIGKQELLDLLEQIPDDNT